MFRTSMTLDRTHRLLTLLSGGLVALGVMVTVAVGASTGVYAFAAIGVALGLAWAMSPRELVVEGGELRIERRAWRPLRVSLADVTSASPLDRIGDRAIRLFGVGGFFGSYGLFSSDRLGRFRLYATRRGPSVLIRRGDDALPIVLTPDDVAGTIDAIDRRQQA